MACSAAGSSIDLQFRLAQHHDHVKMSWRGRSPGCTVPRHDNGSRTSMKRIVICADGTWNKQDQVDGASGKRRPTNVTKMARAVETLDDQGIDQVVYYHSGVGTGGPLDEITGGAFGHGMEANIRAMYRFILYNHAPGDEIYLFGFSRGAFTVRSLAGFMNRYGLVRKEDDYYVPDMYSCYENNILQGSDAYKAAFTNKRGLPRIQKVRDCPPITFLGVWDTVGALGAPGIIGQLFNSKRYQYHDVGLNPSIRYAAHALALDERRKAFKATLFSKPANWPGTLAQAWFAGVHSNVGGSYDPDGLANEALHWMVGHASRCGLSLDPDYLRFFSPRFDSTLNDSFGLSYKLMQLWKPETRQVGNGPACAETVHRSVLQRRDNPDPQPSYPPYRPPQPAASIDALPVVDTLDAVPPRQSLRA